MTTQAQKQAAIDALNAATPAVQATTDASLKLNHASVVSQANALTVDPAPGESPDPTEGTRVVDEAGVVWTFDAGGNCLKNGTPVNGWASRPSAPLYYWKARALYCRGKSETTETWWYLDRSSGQATQVNDPRPGTPPPGPGYDPKQYLTITDAASLTKRRGDLLAAEWLSGLPTTKPTITQNATPPFPVTGVARVERWQTTLRYNVGSGVTVYTSGYCYRPQTPNKKSAILMPGHNGSASARNFDLAAQELVNRGVTVVIHWMIGYGENYSDPNWTHDQFANLGGIVSPFVDHYLVSGNQLLGEGMAVNLLGLSGGGWASLLCRAADARLRRSWHVAGWQPLALWQVDPAVVGGDWEQTAGLGSMSYEDLAAMGWGTQCNNSNDLYFKQIMPDGRWKVALYQPEVDKRAKAVGGSFAAWNYTTPGPDHTLTPELIQAFILDL